MPRRKYAEKGTEIANPLCLRKVMGDSAMARLLDFLTVNRELEYSKSEIAKYSGIGWNTLFRLWPVLEEYDLVKMRRQVGRAQLFRLNMQSPVAKSLDQLALRIADHDNEPVIARELAALPRQQIRVRTK